MALLVDSVYTKVALRLLPLQPLRALRLVLLLLFLKRLLSGLRNLQARRFCRYVMQCVLRHKKETRPTRKFQLTRWHSLTRSFIARLKFEFHLLQKQKLTPPKAAATDNEAALTQELINENAAATAAAAAAAARAAEEAAATEAAALAAEAPRLGLRVLVPVVKEKKPDARAETPAVVAGAAATRDVNAIGRLVTSFLVRKARRAKQR
eukprot:XP_028343869.1 uncharacterized protein LOC114485976 [Physeter catodon]